ncbi:MAG: helix-turn-helix transcriptional regulator [Betaproteobacteria bacterium]|nr:helix-turn-helix transcriptional regulator [Betaproteobacteria bacterium]
MNRHSDALSVTFAALADPTRRAMLLRLSQGEISVSALAEPFQMSLPAATKHLRVLEHAGLVQKSRDAQRRPCRINAEPLKQATDWMAQYRQFWEGSLDRLDAYLQQLQAAEKSQDSDVQALTAKPPVNLNPATDITGMPTLKSAAKKTRSKKHTTSKSTPKRKSP